MNIKKNNNLNYIKLWCYCHNNKKGRSIIKLIDIHKFSVPQHQFGYYWVTNTFRFLRRLIMIN